MFWRGFALFCSDFSVLVLFSRKQQNLGVLAWFCLFFFLRQQQNLCVWRGFALFYSDFSVLVLFHENNKIWVFGVVLPFSFTENQNLGVLAWFCVLVVFFTKKTTFGCFGVVLFFSENNKIWVFWRGFAFWLFFFHRKKKKQNLGVLAWFCLLFFPENNKIWVFWRGFAFFLPKTTKFGSVGVVLRLVVFFFFHRKKNWVFWRGFAFWLFSFCHQKKKNEIWVFWRGSCLFLPKTTKFGCFGVVLRFGCFFTEKKQNSGVLGWFCLFLPKTKKFGSFGVVLPFLL